MNIYKLVLAQIFRFILRAVAGSLIAVGVTTEMQSELVETTVTLIVPIALLVIVEGWSLLQKRYFPDLLKTALSAQPDTDLETVKIRARFNSSKPPVIY